MRLSCLAIGSLLLSSALFAAPITVSRPTEEATNPGQNIGYSVEPLFEVKICKDAYHALPCVLKTKVVGYPASHFVVATRDPRTAALTVLSKVVLVNGVWNGEIQFQEAGNVSLVFMLLRKDEVLAVEGITIEVRSPIDQDRRSIYDLILDFGTTTYYEQEPINEGESDTYYYSPIEPPSFD